jgi:type I restriction enzyme M protein
MLSKQQLGNLLWGMADTGLRGKVEDYKAYILSLLFFKRLSDNYEWETEFRVREFTENYGSSPSPKQRERIRSEGHDFIIPEGCFWKDVRRAETSEKNDKLNSCVQAIAELNKPLKGIINSVRWNEPAPDGSGNKRIEPEVLVAAMNVLDNIPLDNSNVSPDVLGDAYEYLIKRFADENKGGTTAGQFYTPPKSVRSSFARSNRNRNRAFTIRRAGLAASLSTVRNTPRNSAVSLTWFCEARRVSGTLGHCEH